MHSAFKTKAISSIIFTLKNKCIFLFYKDLFLFDFLFVEALLVGVWSFV